MKIILRWLKKNLYVVLFLGLELFSAGLFLRYHQVQEARFFNFCTGIKGRCASLFGGNFSRGALLKENERLQFENAVLRAQMENSFFKVEHDSVCAHGDTLYNQMYCYIPARILEADYSKANNYMVLDAGRNAGVEPGMAVVSGGGVVGIIDKVSARFSQVISVLHSESKVSVRLASSLYTGSLVWPGVKTSEGLVLDIPAHITVNIGEKVVTSGLSLVYPGGITVGYVTEVIPEKGTNFLRLKIRFSEEYASLQRVYIIKNLCKEELEELD